jgi:hypothetical protein
MKLTDILKELNEGRQPGKEITIANLTPEELRKLFKDGSILVPIDDPSRPGSSSSQVINLPKMDQIKKDIIKSKQEYDMFTFYPDDDIKEIAREINKLYNRLYRAMNALDKTIELKKSGRI